MQQIFFLRHTWKEIRFLCEIKIDNNDAPFVSFFVLDGFIRKMIDRVQCQSVAFEDYEIYLKVALWFKGKTKIKVKRLWLRDSVTFLCLSVKEGLLSCQACL